MALSRGLIISIILAILIVAAIGGGYYLYNNSGDEDKQVSRLHLSPYEDGDSTDYALRVEKAKIADIKANIEKFLEPYDINNPKYFKSCDFSRSAPANQTCGIDVARYDPCSSKQNFGLKEGNPCVFLKFDANTEFVPEYYKANEMPENMPDDLELTIQSNLRANPKNEQTMWISCEGVSDEDKRNAGSITILPRRGFLGFFFPCKSEDLCTDPLVALQFRKLQKNVEVNVECRVWAKNADDSITFKLFVE